jgi:transposase-like protein
VIVMPIMPNVLMAVAVIFRLAATTFLFHRIKKVAGRRVSSSLRMQCDIISWTHWTSRRRHDHEEETRPDETFMSSDFFDTRDVVQVKYEMLRQVSEDGASVSSAAAAFGFSRQSYYHAAAALAPGGLQAPRTHTWSLVVVPTRPDFCEANDLLRADLVIIDELGFAPRHRRPVAVPVGRRRLRTPGAGDRLALGFEQWGRFLPEHTTAVSLLDRLLHQSNVVVTEGESFRMRQARNRGGARPRNT